MGLWIQMNSHCTPPLSPGQPAVFHCAPFCLPPALTKPPHRPNSASTGVAYLGGSVVCLDWCSSCAGPAASTRALMCLTVCCDRARPMHRSKSMLGVTYNPGHVSLICALLKANLLFILKFSKNLRSSPTMKLQLMKTQKHIRSNFYHLSSQYGRLVTEHRNILVRQAQEK